LSGVSNAEKIQPLYQIILLTPGLFMIFFRVVTLISLAFLNQNLDFYGHCCLTTFVELIRHLYKDVDRPLSTTKATFYSFFVPDLTHFIMAKIVLLSFQFF
jgi:hypothetical protein